MPTEAILFAALVVIRDREVKGLAGEVLRVAPLYEGRALHAAAEQAMRVTARREDRPLLKRALADKNPQARVIAGAGLAMLDGKKEAAAPVGWADFLDGYLVRGKYDGEVTEFLKGVPV